MSKKSEAESIVPEETVVEIDEIVTEAKKTFSLKDRIQNRRAPKVTTVPVFLDEEAVEEYRRLSMTVEMFDKQYNALTPGEAKDDALAKFNEAEQQRADAKEAMVETILSFHLIPRPDVAVQRMMRKARKAHGVRNNVTLSAEAQELYEEDLRNYELQLVTQKIVASDGSEAEMAPDADGNLVVPLDEIRSLREGLPAAQKMRLDQNVRVLLFVDALQLAGTDDPGF